MGSVYERVYGGSNAGSTVGVVPHPKRRVNIGEDVFLPDNVWDTRTGRVVRQARADEKDPRTRVSAIGLEQVMQKEARERGIRSKQIDISKALVIAMAIFVLLGIFTLINRSSLLDENDLLMYANRSIQQLTKDIEVLTEQIEDAKAETDIGYKAANELGMIRASDAQTIALVAVDAYPAETVQAGYTAEAVVDGWGDAQVVQLQLTANAE